MTRRFVDDAKIETAKRADDFLGAGDMDGAPVWKRNIAVIDEMPGATKPTNAPVH